MPYLEIHEVFTSMVTVRVHVEGYTYFRLFCRPANISTAEEIAAFRAKDFYATFEGLTPGTKYVLNLMYGYDEDDCTNYAYSSSNLPSFTTKTTVAMGIALGSGIGYVTVTYQPPDMGVGTTGFYATGYVDVQSDTTYTVREITLLPGYSHPVYCTGQTRWQMTDANGVFLDNALQMGSVSKTFTFEATRSASTGTGKVWINGQYYQPYIYINGDWQKASAHIYSDGWIETKGG